MIRKTMTWAIMLALFLFGWIAADRAAAATDGPEEMVLLATKDQAPSPKPAVFPHRLHQKAYACSVCHHDRKDGKKIPYTAGMPIKKCEECHFTGSGMPAENDEAAGKVKLDTFQDAAHQCCRTCHANAMAKNPELKLKWRGCLPCHK